MLALYNKARKRDKEQPKGKKEEIKMKVEIRFYENGFAVEAPEIEELREGLEVADRKELAELSKEVVLPAAAEYAHIYMGEEPVIAVTRDGIRDVEADEWIVEPAGEDE